MMIYNDLASRWDNCRGGQILADSSHPLKLYLNVNESGNKELLIPADKKIDSFKSTVALGIRNDRTRDNYFLVVELLNNELNKEFLYLCCDIIESSRCYSNESDARKALFDCFKKWYYLLSEHKKNILDEKQIKGLLGELKFISEEIDTGKTDIDVVEAWKIHKDASRDFIYDNSWYEIKSKESSKNYITISSIEQLDHHQDGELVVYSIDRTEDGDREGISLNSFVDELKCRMGFQAEMELNQKLLSKGYSYNALYDDYVFSFFDKARYKVDASFPKLCKAIIPSAVIRANYDISLSQIEGWKIDE